jgi:hypothetical protein
VARFKADVQRIIDTWCCRRNEPLAARLDPLIRGWGEYFKVAQVEQLYPELDAWVGQRLAALPAPGFRVASLTALLAKRGMKVQGGAPPKARMHATSSREV